MSPLDVEEEINDADATPDAAARRRSPEAPKAYTRNKACPRDVRFLCVYNDIYYCELCV